MEQHDKSMGLRHATQMGNGRFPEREHGLYGMERMNNLVVAHGAHGLGQFGGVGTHIRFCTFR